MCGRYKLEATPEELAALFGVEVQDSELFTKRYNIAPAQHVAVVRAKSGMTERELVLMRWGLIPSWSDDTKMGYSTINAKAETIAEKPTFREAFRARRCLIPADGFYEWKQEGNQKQPMYIRRRDRGPFAFAGIWERWEPKGGSPVESCTIITTEPNEVMQPIHTRMPVILDVKDYEAWLNTANTVEILQALLKPSSGKDMESYAISKMVNNPRFDGPQCMTPV